MLSQLQSICNHFDAKAKSTKYRSDFWGIDSIIPQNNGNKAPDWVQEFRLSAIPDRLTLANVTWIAGDEALQILTETKISEVQSSTSFVGVEAGRILKNAGYIRAGGWCAWGTTLEGGQGATPYIKPLTPRQSYDYKGFGAASKSKIVKYETPQGMPATPLLPWVDAETAQIIFDQYHVKPEDKETFWQVVKRCNIPIALTEGLKKALTLIAHGIPAIALRGITQWRIKGTDDLHPDILGLLGVGSKVYVVFDQDDIIKTQKAVQGQIIKLSRALTEQGADVRIPSWDSSIGKGIDDVLYGLGEDAQAWIDDLLRNAIDYKTYCTDVRTQKAIENIDRHNGLTHPVERATEGEYLPVLPEIKQGAIHVLSATMNAGKTTRIGQDYVKSWTDRDGLVLVLTPINNLGRQAASDWNLPHIHDYATDHNSQTALWTSVSDLGGVVMCGESLHRIPEWFWDKPVLLIMDEANQIIESLTEGNTLGNRYSLIIEKLASTCRCAIDGGAIVLSEDGIPDRAVKFIQTLSGAKTVRVFTHRKILEPWDTTLYHDNNPSGFRGQFISGAKLGQRRIYVTASQREAEKMDRAIQLQAPDLKVVRIDSKTNQEGRFTAFFENPDQWLQDNQPDVLILSPSAKSGVSIEGGVAVENAYFSEVWGCFPALGTDTHMQMLGRYRPSVPRRVFCPKFIMKSSDESITSAFFLRKQLDQNAAHLAAGYGLANLLEERDELKATIEGAVLEYISVAKSVSGSQKQIAHQALARRLERSGHNVQSEKSLSSPEWAKFFKEIREMLWDEEATEIASAEVEEGIHTVEWARKALEGLDTTLETRTIARKVLWRDEFPGMAFDDANQCCNALTRDYGAMARGVNLQARAENLKASAAADEEITKQILSGNIRALHRLPKKHIQALLVRKSGVLNLLEGFEYDSDHPICQAVKEFALQNRISIYYWLRLNIQKTQTAVMICHKLLKKIGIVRQRKDRKGNVIQEGLILMAGQFGSRDDRDEVFRIETNHRADYHCYTRWQLLNAARNKLSGVVQSTCIEEDTLLQINCTKPEPDPNSPKIEGGAPDYGEEITDSEPSDEEEWEFEIEWPEEE
jgi:hypothetical protein